jgi:S-methylmethionine-dependent homocysteine/selenocysteine methylase
LLAEGQAVRKAVAATGKPFRISFTLADDPAQGNDAAPRLRSGETVEDAARWAAWVWR